MIARYKMTGYDPGMNAHVDGGWVAYPDHEATITTLERDLAECRKERDEARFDANFQAVRKVEAETGHRNALARATAAETTNAELRREMEGLREALKPFADQSERFDKAADEMGFGRSFDEYVPKTQFTHGQLRAARAALTGDASNG